MKLSLSLSAPLKALVFVLWLNALPTLAQSGAVWRCGQLLTNQPQPGQACELSIPPASTVVTGTRVSDARSRPVASIIDSAQTPDTAAAASPSTTAAQGQARALLLAELREQEARWQELQTQWNQGRPVATLQQPEGSSAYLERVAQLRAQVQRVQADMAALRRELARLP